VDIEPIAQFTSYPREIGRALLLKYRFRAFNKRLSGRDYCGGPGGTFERANRGLLPSWVRENGVAGATGLWQVLPASRFAHAA